MKCREAREMLNSYIDNGLSPLNDPLLKEHIESCPECREEFEFLIKYAEALKAIKSRKAPDNFILLLKQKLELEKKKSFFNKISSHLASTLYYLKNFNFPVEAAGVLALTILIIMLYKPIFYPVKPSPEADYSIHPVKKTEKYRSPGVRSSIHKKNQEITEYKSQTREESLSVHEITRDKSEKMENKSGTMEKDILKNDDAEKIYFSPAEPGDKQSAQRPKSSSSIEHSKMKKDSALKKQPDGLTLIITENNASVLTREYLASGEIHIVIQLATENYTRFLEKLNSRYIINEKILLKSRNVIKTEIFLKDKKNENR